VRRAVHAEEVNAAVIAAGRQAEGRRQVVLPAHLQNEQSYPNLKCFLRRNVKVTFYHQKI